MNRAAQPPPAVRKIEPHVWRIAIVVILGAIMSVLDTTIVNVALRRPRPGPAHLAGRHPVGRDRLPARARRRDPRHRLGRRPLRRPPPVHHLARPLHRRLALCGLAWSADSLIGARVLQGLGGGMLMPIGQMILVRAAGPRNMARVMSAIGVPIILAPVFGPTLGGLLLEHVGWQWIFFVNLPIGIVAVIAALRLLPQDGRPAATAGKLDASASALVATGLVGITYGLAESGTAGSLLAAQVARSRSSLGIALVATFVIRALRIENPLLDIRLYANKAFAAASVTMFALGAALFGAMVLMPLYFQTVRGEDAVTTGLLLAPQGIGAAIAMGLSGRVTERLGGGLTSLIGGVDHDRRDDPVRADRRRHVLRG